MNPVAEAITDWVTEIHDAIAKKTAEVLELEDDKAAQLRTRQAVIGALERATLHTEHIFSSLNLKRTAQTVEDAVVVAEGESLWPREVVSPRLSPSLVRLLWDGIVVKFTIELQTTTPISVSKTFNWPRIWTIADVHALAMVWFACSPQDIQVFDYMGDTVGTYRPVVLVQVAQGIRPPLRHVKALRDLLTKLLPASTVGVNVPDAYEDHTEIEGPDQ